MSSKATRLLWLALALMLLARGAAGAAGDGAAAEDAAQEAEEDDSDTSSAALPPAAGLISSPEQYKRNILYVQNEALPKGWKLMPVEKWDAYGNGIAHFAPVVESLGMPVAVIYDDEVAAVAKAAPNTLIRRLMPDEGPAKRAAIVESIRKGHKVEELLSPRNLQDMLAAARETNTTIPVQIYLFNHYNESWGFFPNSSADLQKLVDSLDPKLIEIRGLMTHNGGIDDQNKAAARVQKFNRIVCPVAQKLAKKRPIALHYASSIDFERLMPEGPARRAVPDPGLCVGPNITWWARVGSLTYGAQAYENNDLMKGGTSPVTTWYAPVTGIKTVTNKEGFKHKVAVVDLTAGPAYPAPGWWHSDIPAFELTDESEEGKPGSYVFIGDEQFQLADVPRDDGRQLLVDISDAETPVKVGDLVCLVCDKHTLDDFGEELDADDYNVLRCLEGKKAMVQTDRGRPKCNEKSSAVQTESGSAALAGSDASNTSSAGAAAAAKSAAGGLARTAMRTYALAAAVCVLAAWAL